MAKQINTSIGGVIKTIKDVRVGIGGAVRRVKKGVSSIGGVIKEFFNSGYTTTVDTQTWLTSVAQIDSYSITNPSPGTLNFTVTGKGLDRSSNVRCVVYQIFGDLAGKTISFTSHISWSGSGIGGSYQEVNGSNGWTILYDKSLSSTGGSMTINRTISSNADRIVFGTWIQGSAGAVTNTFNIVNITINGELAVFI